MRLAAPLHLPAPPPPGDALRARSALAAAMLAVVLLAFGNGIGFLPAQDHPAVIAAKAVLLVAVVWLASSSVGLSPAEMGLRREGALRGAFAGGALALAASLPIVLYLAFPVGMPDRRIEYDVVDEKGAAGFAVWMLVTLPLATALFEEVMFRGCLQGLAVRAYGMAWGVAVTALTFALWHGVINYKTIRDTNIDDRVLLVALAHGASFAGLVAGGVILSLLRVRTGGVAAPFAFHWVIVAVMNTTLFALSR